MGAPFFSRDLGDGISLGLRTLDTVAELQQLAVQNLDRLRLWEPWAQFDQSLESTRAYTEFELGRFVRGEVVPVVMYDGAVAVGSAGLKIDPSAGNAELGYWIDASSEGRGIVTRTCAALLEHASALGIRRVEIRAATENARSIRVAERLGFEREGVLRQALQVGDRRLDLALYARLL